MGFEIENGVLKKYTEEPGVTEVVIPEGVTSIGAEAFEACGNLTNVTIPDGVASIGDSAFWYCENLVGVVIPNSVTTIGADAFWHCKKLKDITIPVSVASIGDGAFFGCQWLADIDGWIVFRGVLYNYYGTSTDVVIPKEVTSIGSSSFCNCAKLNSVVISDSVTSIGSGAFCKCSSLTSVVIPNSVTIIEEDVFEECSNLRDITIPTSLAKQLPNILPKTKHTIVLHIEDITDISTKYRPGAAAGFAEDGRSCTDENGKKYCKYIKSNAMKLVGLAAEHPALLYLMLREKLIAAKDLDAVTAAVQKTGNAELIAAVLNYGNSAISEQDKEKVRQKKDQRETNVTNFIFDAEKLETLKGKTFVVTGKLKTFVSRDELKECLTACGAALTETLGEGADYLITNTPDSGTAKNKKAVELGVARITEAQFNAMIGRKAEE